MPTKVEYKNCPECGESLPNESKYFRVQARCRKCDKTKWKLERENRAKGILKMGDDSSTSSYSPPTTDSSELDVSSPRKRRRVLLSNE